MTTIHHRREPLYRNFMIGALVGAIGSWMLRTSQLVLVIDVTNGNGLIVGVTTAAQYIPILIISAMVGVEADRRSKAVLLLLGQAVMVVAAIAQALLLMFGVDDWWTIAALACVFGVGAAIDGPMRTAVVPELVPSPDVSRAVSVNVVLLQIGRLVGPVIAAFLIVGASYAATFALSAGLVLVFLLVLPGLSTPPDPVARTRPGGLAAGLRYLRTNPRISVVFFLIGIGGILGPNLVTIAGLMVHQEFGGSATEIGFVSTGLAVGAILGALWATRTHDRGIASLVVLVVLVGVTSGLSAFAPDLVSFVIAMMVAGAVALAMVSRGTVLVQSLVSDGMRGRVTGLYFVILVIGAPVGAPLIGGLADFVGIRAAIFGAGILVAVVAVVLGLIERRLPTAGDGALNENSPLR